MLGTIFRKAQNKIQDPAKLKRLIADLIGRESWTTLDADMKGDIWIPKRSASSSSTHCTESRSSTLPLASVQ